MQNYNREDVQYAGFFVRLSAYILDWIIIGTALLVVKIPKFIGQLINPDGLVFRPVLFKFSTIDILIYILGLAYFVIMTYTSGATLGKKVLNIKVCKSNDEKLTLIDVIYRESIGRYLSSIIMCIGYIMILADTKKRGFHDILCDTMVIYSFKDKNSINNNYNNVNGTSDFNPNFNFIDQPSVVDDSNNNNNNNIDGNSEKNEVNLEKENNTEANNLNETNLNKEN